MKVPNISEEERSEIHRALVERKENLEKLEKKTDELGIPLDRIEERLALYRDGEELRGDRKVPTAGLLSMFSAEPEISAEARQQQDEERERAASTSSSGETGGGNKAGGKTKWKKQRKPGEPELLGDIIDPALEVESPITPPPPRPALALMEKGSPSTNSDIIDPTGPKPPTDEEIERLRNASLGEIDPVHDELAAAASGARPSGQQIDDVRADTRDTKMGGSASDT